MDAKRAIKWGVLSNNNNNKKNQPPVTASTKTAGHKLYQKLTGIFFTDHTVKLGNILLYAILYAHQKLKFKA